MAFKLDIIKVIYGQEVPIKGAYHRIENLTGNKNCITFKLVTYNSNVTHIVNERYLDFVPASDDEALRWDKQAYEYAKSLDEYVDAVDC